MRINLEKYRTSRSPEDTVVTNMGLQYSSDIVQRFHTELDLDAIRRDYPDHSLISWSTELGRVWKCLTILYKINVLPPPLTVDMTRKPPRILRQEPDGEYWNYIGANFNVSARLYTDDGTDDGNVNFICPHDYELRVYHENFMFELDKIWGNKLPWDILIMHMHHLLIHECLHYLLLVDNYQRMIGTRDRERLETTYKMYQDICNYGGITDEASNELKTIYTMMLIWMDTPYGFDPGIASTTEEVNLHVVLNGPFDKFMRKKKPDYRLASEYILYTAINWAQMFGADMQEKPGDMITVPRMILPHPDDFGDVKKEIIDYQKKAWKKEKTKFIIIP